MKNIILIFTLILLIPHITRCQENKSTISFNVDSLILPNVYGFLFIFEVDPLKCNPDIGIVTTEMKMSDIYKSFKQNNLDTTNLIELFSTETYQTTLIYLTDNFDDLNIINKMCKKQQIYASVIHYGYDYYDNNLDIGLVDKAINNFYSDATRVFNEKDIEIISAKIGPREDFLDFTFTNKWKNREYIFCNSPSVLINKLIDITFLNKTQKH